MPQCQACGAFVTRTFVRVFGDNDDEVNGCFSCLSQSAVKRGQQARHTEES